MSKTRTSIEYATLSIREVMQDLLSTKYQVRCRFVRTNTNFVLKHEVTSRLGAERLCTRIRKRNSIDFTQWRRI
jgi:hypothetical protein